MFLGIGVAAGLLAGSYPALLLSGFAPAEVLRGTGGSRRGSAAVRKGLVVVQFMSSVLLLVGTFVVFQQIQFIQTTNLGLDRENVVTLPLEGGAREQYGAFKAALLNEPGIESVSVSQKSPLSLDNSTDTVGWDGKDEGQIVNFYVLKTQYDFPETMRMTIAAGRPFSPAFADSTSFIINETAAHVMGMDDPVGQPFMLRGVEGQVVGVVKDFNMSSMHSAIEPTVMVLDESLIDSGLLSVRLAPGQTAASLAGLKRTFATFSPGVPFSYEFLDTAFGEMYESELRIGTLANVFAVFAAFIACLGLFGLAAFTAEQRRKEVGVRKVLGASVAGLVALLTKDFVALVGVAFAVAVPLAWFAMSRWLDGFAYRADLGAGPFVLAGGLLLGIALLTVGTQALRAATADPVRALRSE